jgi:hypothetical protein
MFRRLVAGGALLLLVSCGGAAATQAPGGPTAAPPADGGATPAPAVTPAGGQGQPNAGDLASIANALVPPGSTEISRADSSGAYVLSVSTTQSLSDLENFFNQAVPAAGATLTGHYVAGDSLIVAFTNPDGGVVATKDSSSGNTIVVISAGISQ